MIHTVYQAKTNLSNLLHEAEKGEEVLIQRGKKGTLFKILPVPDAPARCMEPLPEWKTATRYEDKDILESEWTEED